MAIDREIADVAFINDRIGIGIEDRQGFFVEGHFSKAGKIDRDRIFAIGVEALA
jgi:hypothetical protein